MTMPNNTDAAQLTRDLLIECRRMIIGRAGRGNEDARKLIDKIDLHVIALSEAAPTCPECKAQVLYECVACSASNYPAEAAPSGGEGEPDRSKPPCLECGALTQQEAETKCICAGDKDYCHGEELWPDTPPQSSPAVAKRIENLCAWMNRRVEVEQRLLDAAGGKKPLPDAKECRKLAMRLGDPDSETLCPAVAPQESGAVAWLIEWHRPDSIGATRRVSFNKCDPDDGKCSALFLHPSPWRERLMGLAAKWRKDEDAAYDSHNLTKPPARDGIACADELESLAAQQGDGNG